MIKACGVTFATSLLERLIEERAGGDPARASEARRELEAAIGGDIAGIEPGSAQAEELKQVLVRDGLWSQYLEVGLGPDPEVFTKAPLLSSVGPGAQIGVAAASEWNNPEPEVVLAVSSRGEVVGATLGNDVNLRDFEGRSALLVPKAKDNNASCAIGPLVRLFDERFGMDDVRALDLRLEVEGSDGYVLEGSSSMRKISRDPLDLVRAAHGPHHQHPDGLFLFTGTLFAPTQDRDTSGGGFTHKLGEPAPGHPRQRSGPLRAGAPVGGRRAIAVREPGRAGAVAGGAARLTRWRPSSSASTSGPLRARSSR